MTRRNLKRTIVVGVVLLLIATAAASFYTVDEAEQVVLTQFGRIVSDGHTAPGAHFKLPFVQEVHRFDRRWLEWDGSPDQVPTKDKKYIWVDTYARWRIADPVLFYQRLNDEHGAQSRLDDIIDGEVRNAIATHALIEVVRTSSRPFVRDELADAEQEADESEFRVKFGRRQLTRLVLERASAVMPNYGIELADVQIKRVNYVASVQSKVFERMISERKRIAQRFRSEGRGRSAEINGRIEREQKTIESEAYRKAVEIRGKADAEATAVYAAAYNRDPAFYEFLRTLETYREVIAGNTDVVLSTDAKLLHYLKRND